MSKGFLSIASIIGGAMLTASGIKSLLDDEVQTPPPTKSSDFSAIGYHKPSECTTDHVRRSDDDYRE